MHLEGLTNLKELWLGDTKVTEAGERCEEIPLYECQRRKGPSLRYIDCMGEICTPADEIRGMS